MDLRIKKTYKALDEAFTKLLSEKRYEKISVAALCDEAMIRRTTFYKHFRDKDDYFAFFIDNLRREFLSIGTTTPGGAGRDTRSEREAVLAKLADFLLGHEALMDNIFQSSMSGAMTNVISDAVAEALRERYGAERAEAAEFAAGGIVRLMLLWWHSGHLGEGGDEFVRATDTFVGRVMEG